MTIIETVIGNNGAPVNVDQQPAEFLAAHGMHNNGSASPMQARAATQEAIRQWQRAYSNSSQKTFASATRVADYNAPPERRYTTVAMSPEAIKSGSDAVQTGFVPRRTMNTDWR